MADMVAFPWVMVPPDMPGTHIMAADMARTRQVGTTTSIIPAQAHMCMTGEARASRGTTISAVTGKVADTHCATEKTVATSATSAAKAAKISEHSARRDRRIAKRYKAARSRVNSFGQTGKATAKPFGKIGALTVASFGET